MEVNDLALRKKKVQKLFDWWIKWLGLKWWKIRIDYTFDSSRLPNPDVIMLCEAKWKYLEAVITVNLANLAVIAEDEFENTVVHELMHVFLNETQEEGIEHEERVASTLANGFIWVRDQARSEGKPK